MGTTRPRSTCALPRPPGGRGGRIWRCAGPSCRPGARRSWGRAPRGQHAITWIHEARALVAFGVAPGGGEDHERPGPRVATAARGGDDTDGGDDCARAARPDGVGGRLTRDRRDVREESRQHAPPFAVKGTRWCPTWGTTLPRTRCAGSSGWGRQNSWSRCLDDAGAACSSRPSRGVLEAGGQQYSRRDPCIPGTSTPMQRNHGYAGAGWGPAVVAASPRRPFRRRVRGRSMSSNDENTSRGPGRRRAHRSGRPRCSWGCPSAREYAAVGHATRADPEAHVGVRER